jgi:predicted enzyme related to lactoylglutathione lyase
VTTPRLELMIDCPDAVALAPFWAAALGYEVGDGDGRPYVDLVAPPGRPPVGLQTVPEPKADKTRIHFDLYVPLADAEAEVGRVVGLGATILAEPVHRADGRFNFQILADPVGTEFCICAEDE